MEHKPKIGILTHFNSYQAGYALSVGWNERARLLEYHEQDFDFLVNETCPEGLYPHQLNVLGRMPKDKPFEKRARFFRKNYRQVLEPYDVILTADLIYQRKNNFLAWNQAMRWVNEDFKVRGMNKRWFHWIHSAFTNRDTRAGYPDNLRFQPMDNSTLVYMNESEKTGLAAMYGVKPEQVACVFNPKDFRSFHNFHPYAWEITKLMDFANKDYIQLMPFCTTRGDAKGVLEAIEVAATLKRMGKKVALVLANANARRQGGEIAKKNHMMEKLGLVRCRPSDGPGQKADYIWTSDLVERQGPLPREAVANLFLCSNYFVFGSWREVCPNVLLEARINGNFVVVNQNTAPLVEFAGPFSGTFSAPSKMPGVPDHAPGEMRRKAMRQYDYEQIAKAVIEKAPSRKHLWAFSFEQIWHKQLRPLIYGDWQ